MEPLIPRIFLHNWQRKLVALVAAMIIWLFVNHSITGTKIVPNIPIRVEKLPQDKTILGLLPNGILSRRITLTLSGTKDVVEDLEPGDLEVRLDASTADSDEWIVRITKKNLVSLDPEIDLVHHITSVEHPEFVIKLSRLVTAKIPVSIQSPSGDPPTGYEYLDLWPQRLMQTVSGPEEEVLKLKNKGLELTFDLNDITKGDLESIKQQGEKDDEITFHVPQKWKQVAIPFRNNQLEELNDPEAQNLRIYFLKKQYLPIERPLPIRVFYPLKNLQSINPDNFSLAASEHITQKEGVLFFNENLFVSDVSRLFLDLVRENMEITIEAAPKTEREFLQWSLEIINPHELEDTYVAFLVASLNNGKTGENSLPQKREALMRKRFREYLQRINLYTEPNQKLVIESVLDPEKKEIKVINY